MFVTFNTHFDQPKYRGIPNSRLLVHKHVTIRVDEWVKLFCSLCSTYFVNQIFSKFISNLGLKNE